LKTRHMWLAGTAVIVLVAVVTALRSGGGRHPNRSGSDSSRVRKEIKSVELEIDRIEAESLNRARLATLDRFQQITLLGKIIFYDQELSVKRNESCAFCHMPETGFTGPVSALNQTTVAYPGSVRTRFSGRKPQSHNIRELRTSSPLQSGTKVILSVASSGHARHGTAPG